MRERLLSSLITPLSMFIMFTWSALLSCRSKVSIFGMWWSINQPDHNHRKFDIMTLQQTNQVENLRCVCPTRWILMSPSLSGRSLNSNTEIKQITVVNVQQSCHYTSSAIVCLSAILTCFLLLMACCTHSNSMATWERISSNEDLSKPKNTKPYDT